MKIRAKITLLVTALISVVVGSVVGNLLWVERRRVKAESEARIDALMEGVMRITRESLISKDELMLLSYLKFLMQSYPEIEVAIVSQEGHTSVLGEVRTELFYRTITLADGSAGSFQVTESVPSAPKAPAAGLQARAVPPVGFSIQLGFSKTALDRQIREARFALGVKIFSIAAVGLLLGVLGSLWLGRLLSRPVATLAQAAESIGKGRLDTRVEVRGKDEIAGLGRQFNEMADKIRELLQFKEDLLSTLSHEMRTPLTGLKGFVELLQDPSKPQPLRERQEAYDTMLEAIRQMELSLMNALQLFRAGAKPVLHPEKLDAREILDEVMRLFTPVAQSNDITLIGPAASEPAVLWADRELLRRVIVNLVANAVQYTPPGGSVSVNLAAEGDQVSIAVADTGQGIAPEDRERIFQRFYRAPTPDGRPQRIPGSGLGLAIAKQAVDLHAGRIWVDSKVGEGSVFHVTLPNQGGTHENAQDPKAVDA